MPYRNETKCPCCQSAVIYSRSDGWKCGNCGARWDLQIETVDPEPPKTWLGMPIVCPEDEIEGQNRPMYVVSIESSTETAYVGKRETLQEANELIHQAMKKYIAPLKPGESMGSPLTDGWYIYHDLYGEQHIVPCRAIIRKIKEDPA